MNYRTAGQDAVVAVDLLVGGDLVVPDANQVAYTVRKNDGTVLTSGTLTLAVNATRASLTVLAANNAQTLDYEMRSVTFRWLKVAAPYEVTYTYRLVPWLLIPVEPAGVRHAVGASLQELPDSDVDLIKAYYRVQDDVGETLQTLFTAGDAKAAALGEAIRYAAALDVVDTLELRVLQKEQGDNVSISRFSNVDFDALRARLAAAYAKQLDLVTEATSTADFTLSVTQRPSIDPVTGSTPV